MAAEIMGQYPNYWPETIRALIVHSAEWTENMKKDFLGVMERNQITLSYYIIVDMENLT
jgi:hypothetical protein